MTCNIGSSSERGLRCNLCSIVKSKTKPYLSAHVLGKAGDFTVDGISAFEARGLIKESASLLPCKIRLEGEVSWLHIDVLPQFGVNEKVYEFKG